MKKSIALVIIFISLTASAQLTETTTSSVPATIGSFNTAFKGEAILTSKVADGDTIYTLLFRTYNPEKTNFNKVVFKEKGETLNSLYEILSSFFSKENKKNQDYKKTFKLGDEDITCLSERTSNTSIIFKTNEGFISISERQLHKLFGK